MPNQVYEKYKSLDFDLPFSGREMDEMMKDFCIKTVQALDKQLEEQFKKVMKQALLSGDFVKFVDVQTYNSKLAYIPYYGRDALRAKYDRALEVLEEHGLSIDDEL